jgi:hypothetical protein
VGPVRIVLNTAGCTIFEALKELRRRIINPRSGAQTLDAVEKAEEINSSR